MPFQYAILGMGPAGIFVLASLPEELLESTLVIEKHCIGGELASKYGSIQANIPKQTIVSAFQKIPRWASKSLRCLQEYADEECPRLSDVTRQMREWILPDIRRTHFHTTTVLRLHQAETHWNIECEHDMFEAKNVIVCTGSLPKTMNLPKASIPLPIALHKTTLEQQVSKSDKVVVFGTAHSGTLVLRNLYEIGCTGVVAMYRGNAPFLYARNGVPGGIKEESARIADAIVGNQWGIGAPKLVHYEDFAKVYRAVEKADVVIYAIGFETTKLEYLDLSGATRQLDHDWDTGRFRNLPNIWGFGIAFPSHLSQHPSFPDIGFDGFITAIHTALPSILQSTS
jgi:hypothetical protein